MSNSPRSANLLIKLTDMLLLTIPMSPYTALCQIQCQKRLPANVVFSGGTSGGVQK
jgi:hypothetical protein